MSIFASEINKIMFRYIVKASCLFLILFQTNPPNFLNATETTNNNNFPSSRGSMEKCISATICNTSSVMSYAELQLPENKEEDGGKGLGNRSRDELIESSAKIKHNQVSLFEQKLLKLLGMKNRPMRDKSHRAVPNYFKILYENQLESDVPTSNLNLPGRLTRSANTVRSFYDTGGEMELNGFIGHLKFEISSIPEEEEIMGAELHIPFVINETIHFPKIIQVLIHDVVKIPKIPHTTSNAKFSNKSRNPISYPIDSRHVKLTQSNSNFWLSFDVFPAFSRRKMVKYKNHVSLAIEIIAKKSKSQNILSINPVMKQIIRVRRSINSNKNSSLPTLLTFSDDGINPKKPMNAKILSRKFRSHMVVKQRRNHRQKNRRRNLCSRKKMFVDFTDVGWNDWIVAPPGYQAFYCSGECPFPMAEHLNATNHAVIQSLVNSMNPRLVPLPCCVPNKYSSLSLLYTDSTDRIVLKNYNEMIVDSCGCS